jgi:polyisoprenoid-binding protein YceI
MKGIYTGGLAILLHTQGLWAQAPSETIYTIDGAKSRVELVVSREGLLKSIGHNHTILAKHISGEVRLNSEQIEDSSVHWSIESASLVVLEDPDLSEKDRKEVQANMQGARILHVESFPKIEFHSTRASDVTSAGENFTLTGRLTLHGVEKEIAFPVRIHVENNLLRATGATTIAQTAFGIRPLRSVLGALRVKDQIKVTFDIAAEKTAP